MARINKHGYQISTLLYEFVENEVLPNIAVTSDNFWQGATQILDSFIPQNKALLEKREWLQTKIDQWHQEPKNAAFNGKSYQQFLTDIGYLVPEQDDFVITTENVDPEVASIAGPQLVVPLMNARFALNAANARWGSLYDALYGTDVIAHDVCADTNKTHPQNSTEYNPQRGAKVQAYAKRFLDQTIPLVTGSHSEATTYSICNEQLIIKLNNGQETRLAQPELFVGYTGQVQSPSAVLCCHHGLHIDILFDAEHPIGRTDIASIKDIILESAVSTIQDCEDSIAAVDCEDKVLVYRNWLGLMNGSLSETIAKNGQKIKRQLAPDRHYLTPQKQPFSLSGRSLLFIRNVGHLMCSPLILTADNNEVPEGLIDGLITSLIALHDIAPENSISKTIKNSQHGSIYIVKPKMHGPEEVAFSHQFFTAIEDLLQLPHNTIKMGIMDEERRTSANLKECIRAAKERVAFINTGFLDRTGDEIHTSMHAGPMALKDQMKDQPWISAYENRNVNIGLSTGFIGKGQIGKGMWATPDEMSAMMSAKIAHPLAGASCAWVPSPTAATLHAIHYHQVNVATIQHELLREGNFDDRKANHQLTQLLTLPLLVNKNELTAQQIQEELDNNVQGLLGYVVRWVEQGIGCSKVPDIHNVGRMEDRATLRISSQHICNWLHHGILTQQQVRLSLEKMAKVVDNQNGHDPLYSAMSNNFDKSIAFQAAIDLVFKGKEQPSGYTEPLLHQCRQAFKLQK